MNVNTPCQQYIIWTATHFQSFLISNVLSFTLIALRRKFQLDPNDFNSPIQHVQSFIQCLSAKSSQEVGREEPRGKRRS